jgi:hypothetical protein
LGAALTGLIMDGTLSEIHTCGGVDVEGDRGGFAAVQHAASDIGP